MKRCRNYKNNYVSRCDDEDKWKCRDGMIMIRCDDGDK